MEKHDYKLLNKQTLSRRTLNRQVGIIAQAMELPYYKLHSLFNYWESSMKYVPSHELFLPQHIRTILTKLAHWLPVEGDPVFMVLVFLILTEDNPFTRAADKGQSINPLSLAIARRDLETLECLARTGSKRLFDILALINGSLTLDFDGISICDKACDRSLLPEFQRMLDLFASPTPWSVHIHELERWHRKWGHGIALCQMVFEAKDRYSEDLLTEYFLFKPLLNASIPHPADFIGYEDERNAVRENTRRFLAGLPAHDMLLSGDRGTGKSSTVKLMLREFSAQGLRFISTENSVDKLKIIFTVVRNQRWKYILFIDDISFSGFGNSALEFRSLIQGDLTDRPSNVIFYVTSNRRTIVRMDVDDTDKQNTRVSDEDRQEILALSDRFGLKVWFQMPTQEEYLDIVRGLAKQYKITLPEEELVQQALTWERWNNVRSPRSAQQFVRSLVTTPLPE